MKTLNVLFKGERYSVLLDDDTYDLAQKLPHKMHKSRAKLVLSLKYGNVTTGLHRIISGASPQDKVKFIDGDELNLQRANLKVCPKSTPEDKRAKRREYYLNNSVVIKRRASEWYKNNSDVVKKRAANFNKTEKGRKLRREWTKLPKVREHYKAYYKMRGKNSRSRFMYLARRAKAKKLDMDLNLEDYRLISEAACEYCQAPFDPRQGGSGLDRKNNKQGYVKTNVVPCCTACNRIKNEFLSHQEMKVAMSAVLEFRKLKVVEIPKEE